MITVNSAFVRYNANYKDQNVGDCVKRSLSYAYGMDYNDVGRELNRIKNAIGSFAYNVPRTYNTFLRDHGAVRLPKDQFEDMTEDEFASKFPTGIYILLTGKDKTGSTHMVCIFNGDIVDSWNSSNYIVHEAWEIKNVHSNISDVMWDDIADDMMDFAENYLASINKKYGEWFIVWMDGGYLVNPQTYRMKFYLRTDKNLPDESEYYGNQKYMKRIVVKINPRMDRDQNLASLKPKLKQSIYDWVYPYQKDMRDTKALQNLNAENYQSRYDKKNLLKLPEWVRPQVKYFWIDPNGYNKYELTFKALPDDPYIEDRGDTIRIGTDTFKDLKDELEMYKDGYRRVGYDY